MSCLPAGGTLDSLSTFDSLGSLIAELGRYASTEPEVLRLAGPALFLATRSDKITLDCFWVMQITAARNATKTVAESKSARHAVDAFVAADTVSAVELRCAWRAIWQVLGPRIRP